MPDRSNPGADQPEPIPAATVEPATARLPFVTRWLGIGRAASREILIEQEARYSLELHEAERRLAQARARHQQLQLDLAQREAQLKAARGVVEVLREKLAKERTAKALLATRLMDQQVEELKAQQAAALAENRIRAARTSAEIELEMEGLRQLVRTLYRTVAGKAGIPEGLEVAISDFSRGDQEPDTWHRLMTDKRLGRPLATPDGLVLAEEGDPVTPELLVTAVDEGLLWELIQSVKLPSNIGDR